MNKSKNLQLQSIQEEIIHENLWFAIHQIDTLESDKTLKKIKDYILDLDESVYKMENNIDIDMANGFSTHIIRILKELTANE